MSAVDMAKVGTPTMVVVPADIARGRIIIVRYSQIIVAFHCNANILACNFPHLNRPLLFASH